MTKAAPLGQITDVTKRFKGVNEYDRIYETPRGYLVKVRVTAHPVLTASLTFDITASWADDEGKARRFDDASPFLLAPHQHVVAADSPVDLATELEEARIMMVNRVDLAAANYYAASALKHVRNPPQAIN